MQALDTALIFVGQFEVELHSCPALRDCTLLPHLPYSSVPERIASLAYPDLHRKWLKTES